MDRKIDWHYHLSGRNIKEDVLNLKKYTDTMDQVYVMASYFPEKGSGLSNYNLYYHLKEVEKVKLYLSLDFEHYFYQGLNEINSIISESPEKIIGIKIYTGYQNIKFDERFDLILDIAKKNNLYVMFHTGYLNESDNVYNPINLDFIIRKNKDIKFILAHLGNPYLEITTKLINKYDNVFTDISGLTDNSDDVEDTLKYVREFAKKVNKEKILFGTDYPVQNYKDTIKFAKVFI